MMNVAYGRESSVCFRCLHVWGPIKSHIVKLSSGSQLSQLLDLQVCMHIILFGWIEMRQFIVLDFWLCFTVYFSVNCY